MSPFAYAFVIAVVISTALGRNPAKSPPLQVSFEDLDIQTTDDKYDATVRAEPSKGFNRSTDLKFVTTIKNSAMWSEIKKRSMTIKTTVPLPSDVIDKSPGDLSDRELAALKQACHDALKCVAVDQLLVLKQVMQPTGDGSMSVRTVITKITKVLSEYTNEYHRDEYQYTEVKENDEPSKVYETVTTIVKDNTELCRVDDAKVGDERPDTAGQSDGGDALGGVENAAPMFVVSVDTGKPSTQHADSSTANPNDMKQFLSSVDKMYSSILNGFSEN